jgi:choline dehydrogenase-like flavoprotein
VADFDVVIVGSGAGGGIAALALASRGHKVALLEKGRNPYPTLADGELSGSLFGNDELRRRRYYAFHDPLIEPRTFRDDPTKNPKTVEVQGLGVTVGGGTVQYDGDCPRLTSVDMKMLSTFGAIAGADVVDWPFDYSELVPFYDEVEKIIGVQGLAGADVTAEPRGPFPMPPGYPSKAGLVLSQGAKSLGYHPHPMPMAINSMFYRGRPACVSCGFCAMGCPVNAKGSTAVTAVRDALASGNCTLITESCVSEVLVEPSGARASGVRYIDAKGKEQTLTATQLILAANAIETPRLLLASTSSAHPDGLGNQSGLVGRHLMFHVIFAAIGVFDQEIRSYRGRPITHAMGDFTTADGMISGLRGGYVELGGSIHPVEVGVSFPVALHKSLMTGNAYRNRIASVSMIGEDVPVADNRVELDPIVRDVYGRPAPRITYRRHPHDQSLVDTYMPKLEAIAKAAGAKSTVNYDFAKDDGVPSTRHLMGTTRMGVDPTSSVADPTGRLHTVENVWIADGGIWPTSTAFNPTLTQQALALRTALEVDKALGK